MLRDVLILMSCATAIYAWLCAIVPPLLRTIRATLARRAGPGAWLALGLAAGAGVLWTVVAGGGVLLFMMLEPGAGLALLGSVASAAGLGVGVTVWAIQWLSTERVPRFGSDFELASALAIVALVRDDTETLGRVEHLYRAYAIDPRGGETGRSALRRAAA